MKKLIESIKKMLGIGDKTSGSSDSSKGFTLIELLIVIAVIGILAAALLVGIDPIDKINAGNDTKVVNNARQIYDGALRAYTNSGIIPANPAAIVTAGELKAVPVPPGNYNPAAGYAYYVNGTNDDVSVCMQIKSKGQRQKQNPGGASPATASIFISGGQLCYYNAACTAAYMPTTTAGARCTN